MIPLIVTQERSNWCWAACLQMCLSGFRLPVPSQCDLATLALPWQGEQCGDCCTGGPPAPNAVDPCNLVLDTIQIQKLYRRYNLGAQLAGNVPPTESDLRVSLGPMSLALILVDLGVFHFMLVFAYDRSEALYSVANPAPQGGGLMSKSWTELNSGEGVQYLWRVTTLAV